MNNSTNFRLAIVALLACVLCGTRVSAQEQPPVSEDAASVKPAAVPTSLVPAAPVAESKMPDISGTWSKGKDGEHGRAVVTRDSSGEVDFVVARPDSPADYRLRFKWSATHQRFEGKESPPGPFESVLYLQFNEDQKTLRYTTVWDETTKNVLREKGFSQKKMDAIADQQWVRERDANGIPEIVGTWSRAESGTFSKLTIWPVENREFLFFVEGADGNGLLEWKPVDSNFQGFFTFNLLGDRTAPAYLVLHGPKETRRLIISPFDDQRIQLLRSDFAKTERELDKKLSSDWTRVEAPAQPMPTVAVVKTEFESKRIRELLRAKYREQPYRFFSNDTNRSVIVLAPAEAQEDIEVLIHKLDIKDEPNHQWVSPNIAQAAPANQPQATSRRPDDAGATASSPEAKRLRKNLQAQESAAAAEAATIRQLQANGPAEQNQPPIAEHQRKLQNLLSTAFDLKLQWEELQVKELQSRLSRLERQIGQRKELREKIITRRGAELIEGAVLKWNPDGSSPNQTADSRTNGDKSATSDVVRSSSTDQSYQEFAKKLGTMNSSVAEAEEALSRAERDAGSDLVIDTVPRARRRFEEAIRNKKAIQYEYAAVLRDLELQIESAQAEVDAAKKIADYDQQLVEQRVSPLRKLEEAQLRLKQATLMLERLKVKHNLYKKAGEGLDADDPLNPKLSQIFLIDRPLDAESAAKLIWDKIGLKFGEPVAAEKLGLQGSKYRGGLPIVDVREAGSEKKAFNKGDVLVGLDKWETTSPDNVVGILKQFEAVPQAGSNGLAREVFRRS